jgi:two-component system response regulator
MQKKAILLVEDHHRGAGLTKRAFEQNRIHNELVAVADGQEALDYPFGVGGYAGRDTSKMCPVIVLDLDLPQLGGLEVLKRIPSHALTKHLPVVILPASRAEQDVAMSYDLGANISMHKPVDFHHIAEAVRDLDLYWVDTNAPPPLK